MAVSLKTAEEFEKMEIGKSKTCKKFMGPGHPENHASRNVLSRPNIRALMIDPDIRSHINPKKRSRIKPTFKTVENQN